MNLSKLIVILAFIHCRYKHLNLLADALLEDNLNIESAVLRSNYKSFYNVLDEVKNTNEAPLTKVKSKSESFANSSLVKTREDDEFVFLVAGGYRPEKNDLVKYVVSLRRVDIEEDNGFGAGHFCGGSIISKKVILTAAHCLAMRGSITLAKNIKVIAGTTRRLLRNKQTQELTVASVKLHPNYYEYKKIYDIALIKLKDELDLNEEFVSIIPIANEKPLTGQLCTIIGWGVILEGGPVPDDIGNGDVTINSDAYCASRISGFNKDLSVCMSNPKNYEVSGSNGDSGGPLICDNKVVGIAAYVVRIGHATLPFAYTNVYYFREWILRNGVCCLTNKLEHIFLAFVIAFINQNIF
ncbi:mast cell protease 8-like isoform X3 [Drosophila albomicans]|uniref:trypsin n=1 Tax=Drosophila albomicans TaxID=7291 RepID=A0A9C6SV91_DROAB|nr:mast cell protease 8-like isoform X3 [Drosophila albomicans]